MIFRPTLVLVLNRYGVIKEEDYLALKLWMSYVAFRAIVLDLTNFYAHLCMGQGSSRLSETSSTNLSVSGGEYYRVVIFDAIYSLGTS